MPGARVKVCGVTREGDLDFLDGRVDYVGFIVGPPVSPRVLRVERARELAGLLGRSRPVLVVQGVGEEELLGLVEGAPEFQVVQYHVGVDAVRLARLGDELKERGFVLAPVSLWDGERVFPPPCEAARAVGEYEYLLVDAVKGKPLSLHPGGLKVPLSVFREAAACTHTLGGAGGVRPENACNLIRAGVRLVDVSSGVERSPGVKDPVLIDRLLEVVRSC